jgi:hypothetical protein
MPVGRTTRSRPGAGGKSARGRRTRSTSRHTFRKASLVSRLWVCNWNGDDCQWVGDKIIPGDCADLDVWRKLPFWHFRRDTPLRSGERRVIRYPVAETDSRPGTLAVGILAYDVMKIEFSNTITAGDIIVIALTSVAIILAAIPLVMSLVSWWRGHYKPITMGCLSDDGSGYVKVRRVHKGIHELKLRLTTRKPLDLNRIDVRFVESRLWGRKPRDADSNKIKILTMREVDVDDASNSPFQRFPNGLAVIAVSLNHQ